MNNLRSDKCFICKNNANSNQQDNNHYYTCTLCGNYYVSNDDPPKIDEKYQSIIRGYVYENQSPTEAFHLSQDIINTIKTLSPIAIDEKIHKLMLWFEKKTNYPGETIKSIYDKNELIPICYANDLNEMCPFGKAA